MSSLKNKLSLKSFGLVYGFKCHYNTIAPGHLIPVYWLKNIFVGILGKKTC